MSPPRGSEGAAALRRFLLATPPADGAARLAAGEAEHALRVLRLGVGDALVGLDGEGGAWPLEVRGLERGEPRLVVVGPVERTPRPGEPGAALPWIEIAAPLPRGARAEEMVDRLVQLGVSVLRPIVWERSGPDARESGAGRRRRLARAIDAACKQADRRWRPELEETVPASELLLARGTTCLLAAEARTPFVTWSAERRAERAADPTIGTRGRPLLLLVGPEGGLAPREVATLRAAGAAAARLGPHVLRLETAAEAAVAVLAATWIDGADRSAAALDPD